MQVKWVGCLMMLIPTTTQHTAHRASPQDSSSHVNFTLVLLTEEVGQLPSEVGCSVVGAILEHCVGGVLTLVGVGGTRDNVHCHTTVSRKPWLPTDTYVQHTRVI